jgi:chromosome segregation ATPase
VKILEFLSSKKPQSSITIGGLIAEAEAEWGRLGPALEQLAERRRNLLLAADDAALDAIEREQQATARQLDRLDVVIEELAARQAAAQLRERVEHIDALYESAVAAQKRGAAALQRYVALAGEMRDLLLEIESLDGEREQANRALADAADDRRADAAEALMTRRADRHHATKTAAQVALPNPEDFREPIWPPKGTHGPISVAPQLVAAE